jgi:hypothetical protein
MERWRHALRWFANWRAKAHDFAFEAVKLLLENLDG